MPLQEQEPVAQPENKTITFRGVTLKFIDVRQGKEGGDVFCRMHLSSELSEQVQQNMNWDEIPESITECNLAGEVLASNLILTPGDPALAHNNELQFAISNMEDFQVRPVRNKEGDIVGRTLHFIVRTPQQGVGAMCEEYIRRVGRHQGQMKISYDMLPKTANGQGNLDLNTGAGGNNMSEEKKLDTFGPDDGPCTSCNIRTPFEDKEQTTHINGARCARVAGSTLAAAATIGGTRKRRPQRRNPEPDQSENPMPEDDEIPEVEPEEEPAEILH